MTLNKWDKQDTRSKIITVAVELIGKQVNMNVTTREIAREANVNLASINYYFRSKDNLFNEVEQFFANESRKIYEELEQPDVEPRDKIARWALRIIEHLMEYPGILFMIATKLIQDQGKNPGIVELINNSEASLRPIMKELTGLDDEEAISFKEMQLMSGVLTPVLMHHGAGNSFGIDLNKQETRVRYIESLINTVI